jgi:hypothetical protein
MPERWQAAFEGRGELDLTVARPLSDSQVMWSAARGIESAAVFAASKAVNTATEKLKPENYPGILRDMHGQGEFSGAVYHLPELVLDTKTLVAALAAPLQGRLFRGEATHVTEDGELTVSGQKLSARSVFFTAGRGNEGAFGMLGVAQRHAQRRPLRMLMVKTLDTALHGHGIIAHYRPRVTVTSHPLPGGGYAWYLGANVAEQGVDVSEDAAIRFAVSEMNDMFPTIDWANKDWASVMVDRAEPYDETGRLPPGPHVHVQGRVLIAWPTKMTFAPAMSDKAVACLADLGLAPSGARAAPPALPPLAMGQYPWETAGWRATGQEKAA